jgi:hypothetical protein
MQEEEEPLEIVRGLEASLYEVRGIEWRTYGAGEDDVGVLPAASPTTLTRIATPTYGRPIRIGRGAGSLC